MALTAVVVGTAMAVLGTGRVTIPLILSTAVLWSFVPILQLLTGLVLTTGRGPSRGEALAAYFATGHYWSIWILAITAVLLVVPEALSIFDCLALSSLVPAVLTARALARLRRQMFGDTAASARRWVMLHQGITHVMLVSYVVWAIALWPRVSSVPGQ